MSPFTDGLELPRNAKVFPRMMQKNELCMLPKYTKDVRENLNAENETNRLPQDTPGRETREKD